MVMSKITEKIRARARENIKTIVLAEGEDVRVIEAAKIATEEKFANIILLGNPYNILAKAKENGWDLGNIPIINPARNTEEHKRYTEELYRLRGKKGLSYDEAGTLCHTALYYGTMMVQTGDADGMVCGAITSSADVMRAALRVIKTAPATKLVSTSFLMCVGGEEENDEERVFAFADCVVNVNPTPNELADIAAAAAKTYTDFTGDEARVAMLSYTTYGMDTRSVIHKMQEAAYIAKREHPSLNIDGEMQLDAAIDMAVAQRLIKNYSVAGRANVLIFPDLNSGNISYKIVQRLCGAEAIGPIMQGLAKPINDLSRGCNAEEVANVAAITAVQAANI